jgi:hypothetical protein
VRPELHEALLTRRLERLLASDLAEDRLVSELQAGREHAFAAPWLQTLALELRR